MKLTFGTLYDLSSGLNKLLDKELPTKVALFVQQNYKKVSDELNPSNEVRKSLIEKYKEKENEDGSVQLKKDKVELYKKEVNELMEQQVDIDLKSIKLSDLGESIKPRTLGLLEPIIKEEETE